jgi:hypothetical protein
MEPMPFMTFKNPQGVEMLRKATPDEIINYKVEKRMNDPSKKNVGGRKKSRKVCKRNRKQNTRRKLNKTRQYSRRRLNKRKQSKH